MLGRRQAAQTALFFDFSIEDHVLRTIDGVINLSRVRTHLMNYYNSTSRPSVDPEQLMRMLLVGCIKGIRSGRRLFKEVQLNSLYCWLCKLDLTNGIPNHSIFHKNRRGMCSRQRSLQSRIRCSSHGTSPRSGFISAQKGQQDH